MFFCRLDLQLTNALMDSDTLHLGNLCFTPINPSQIMIKYVILRSKFGGMYEKVKAGTAETLYYGFAVCGNKVLVR